MKLIPIYFKRSYEIFLILVFISITGFCQNSNNKTNNVLAHKNYNELAKGFYNYEYTNPQLAKLYSKAYLTKGKIEKDTVRIANAYSQLGSLLSIEHLDISMKYADSIIFLTKKMNDETYPSLGYLIKATCYNNKGRYKLALKNYYIAQKHAKLQNNIEQLFLIKNQIGHLKYFWGDVEESKEIFKSQLKLLTENKDNFKDYNNLYSNTLYRLSNSYIFAKQFDSALYFSKIGFQKIYNFKKDYLYSDFMHQGAEIAFYKKSYIAAQDSLNKIPLINANSEWSFIYHVLKGKISQKQGDLKESFFHFSKADSIYNATNDIVPDVHDVHEFFVNYYKTTNDLENQLKYINKLVKTDSIINNNRRELSKSMYEKYDIPILLNKKQAIINQLKADEQKTHNLLGLLIAIVLMVLSLTFYIYNKQLKYKKRFNKLMKDSETSKETKPTESEPKTNDLSGISEEITSAILIKLDAFEKNESFTENSINLQTLAEAFNTNSNYLSKIINVKKGQNFSTYLTELRINYALVKLKTDPVFRKYSIKSIALETGFNNAESFSKAFYKKTGIYPSYYIKEMETCSI